MTKYPEMGCGAVGTKTGVKGTFTFSWHILGISPVINPTQVDFSEGKLIWIGF